MMIEKLLACILYLNIIFAGKYFFKYIKIDYNPCECYTFTMLKGIEENTK